MPLMGNDEGNERVTVWRCIGCGRIEGPQPCIGVCEDRKIELVDAAAHDQALGEIQRLRAQRLLLWGLVRQLANTTPRDGEWERSYRALQARARQMLTALEPT